MITRMDRDVGRILAELKQLGLAADTLVMFTSDNGPHAGDRLDPEFNDSNGPLRGALRDVYEGGIRVPMIARWPSRTPPGQVSDHVCSLVDRVTGRLKTGHLWALQNRPGIGWEFEFTRVWCIAASTCGGGGYIILLLRGLSSPRFRRRPV